MSLSQLQALEVLREAARVSPVPWPGAILAVVTTVVEFITDARTNNEDLIALRARLLEVAGIVIPAISKEEIASDESLLISIRVIASTLERLGAAVRNLLSQGKIKSFLRSSTSRLAVKQAQQEFELAVDGLILRLSLSNLRISERAQQLDLGLLKEEIERTQLEQLNAIKDEVQKMACISSPDLAISDASLQEKVRRLPEQVLPAGSGIFYGRDKELTQLLSLFVQPDDIAIAILGPGGIGKTSLALSLLHHEDIVARYKRHRYFIACDALPNPEALFERFANTLALAEKKPLPMLKKLTKEMNQPVLVVLDNLETTWEPNENRTKLEIFLSELSLVPGVSVIVTLRGAERPAGVAWTKPFLSPLQPLGLEAAIQVFSAISDTDPADPHIRDLIQNVDMVPLAVTLIAAQAQFLPCAELLRQWKVQKTKMVTSGFDGRLSSLDISIELSLESARFKQSPSAKRLLQLLSLLPDGGSDSFLKALTEEKFPFLSAAITLLRTSLALRDAQGLLRCLSPVRDYVSSRMPISGADLATSFEFLTGVGDHYLPEMGKAGGTQLAAEWTPQFGNLRSILEECISRPSDIHPLMTAEAAWRFFKMLTGTISAVDLDTLLRRAVDLARHQGFEVQAAKLFVEIFNKDDDPNQLLQTLRSGGEYDALVRLLVAMGTRAYYSKAQVDRAWQYFNEAWLVDQNSITTQTRLLLGTRHAEVLIARQPVKATRLLSDAMQLAEAGGFERAARQAHTNLCRVERRRGFYSKSRFHTQSILNLLSHSETSFGIALYMFSWVLLLQGQLAEAESVVLSSQQIFHQLEVIDWSASTLVVIFTLRMAQGRLSEVEEILRQYRQVSTFGLEASLSLTLALKTAYGDLSESRNLVTEVIRIRRRNKATGQLQWRLFAGDLWLYDGRIGDAQTSFITLLINACTSGYRLGTAMALLRLGDTFRVGERDAATAKICYQASWELVRHIGAPRHLADCLLRLGVSQAFLGSDLGISKLNISQAKAAFERSRFPPGIMSCDSYLEILDGESEQSQGGEYFTLDAFPFPTIVGWNDFS